MTPLRATRYSKSHACQGEPIHCDVGHRFGRRDRYKLEKVESYANEERFFPAAANQIVWCRCLVQSVMLFPHATPRPLKAMEAYGIVSLSWVCTVISKGGWAARCSTYYINCSFATSETPVHHRCHMLVCGLGLRLCASAV